MWLRHLIRTSHVRMNNLSAISTPLHGRSNNVSGIVTPTVSRQSFSSNTSSWMRKLKDKASPPKYDKWKFRFYLVLAGLIFPLATGCVVPLAYPFDEYQKEIARLRRIASYPVEANASLQEHTKGWLFASTMKVVVFYAETVLFLWRLYDDRDIILPEELKEHRYMLVLDLNETLVFSGWTRGTRGWVTVKRPGVGEFLDELSPLYEIVVFSNQFQMYVDAVLDQMDPSRVIKYRLSRFDMKYDKGKRVKDFVCLKRDISKVIYVTSYPNSSCNINPLNTVSIQAWKGTPGDTGLRTLTPFLAELAKCAPEDVRPFISSYKERPDDVVKQLKARSLERRSPWWRELRFLPKSFAG